MNFTEHEKGGVVWLTAPVISAVHGFSTRFGGVSAGGFASLNLGYGRGDPAENVTENYRRLGAAIGFDAMNAAFTKQVHRAEVRVVTDADRRAPYAPAAFEADGLVTNVPGLPILAFTADCVPVLLHDPVAGTAGAVHCGWRSSVADILGAAVEKMCGLGSDPGNIRAAIGPAIGACCFETDADVPEAVARYLGGDTEGLVRSDERAGKFWVDLKNANRRRLLQLGLEPAHVAVSDACTVCENHRYWSHRAARGGERGSQCCVIVL